MKRPSLIREQGRRLLLFSLIVPVLALGCHQREQSEPAQTRAAPLQWEQGEAFSGNNAYLLCRQICRLGPRPSGSSAYELQLQLLEQRLHSAGWQTQRRVFTTPAGREMTNLHAFFGEGSHTRPLLFSCHIDTKSGIPHFIGADDGASGAAVLAELARVLPTTPARACQIELVFFDGEESYAPHMSETDGLYGSRYDVRRRGSHLPRWQINLDMVGGASNVIAIPALDTSDTMYRHYAAAIRATGLSPQKWTVYPGSYLDDHTPFVEAGVDTLNLICDFKRGNWWHTSKDDFSRIRPSMLEQAGRISLQLALQLLP